MHGLATTQTTTSEEVEMNTRWAVVLVSPWGEHHVHAWDAIPG